MPACLTFLARLQKLKDMYNRMSFNGVQALSGALRFGLHPWGRLFPFPAVVEKKKNVVLSATLLLVLTQPWTFDDESSQPILEMFCSVLTYVTGFNFNTDVVVCLFFHSDTTTSWSIFFFKNHVILFCTKFFSNQHVLTWKVLGCTKQGYVSFCLENGALNKDLYPFGATSGAELYGPFQKYSENKWSPVR